VAELRSLIVVLGDQLDLDAAAFDDFDAALDAVWMAEVAEESTHVWSSKPRIVMFLAAMRHFALALQAAGRPLQYTRLDAPGSGGNLGDQLQADILRLKPARLVMTAPGDWRVLQAIKAVAEANAVPLDIREDRHFFASIREFSAHAKDRKSLRMEFFYREQRKRHGVLMQDGEPIGGQWNFDADNREAFGAGEPGAVPPRTTFAPDAVTLEVIALVNTRFAAHPGRLNSFAWPVTRAQALQSLRAFIAQRLLLFGRYQDAIWPGDPWLYHAHLSAALNLKLLNPREVVAAAQAAYRDGHAPLASVEGFIRQILGWREYVRGIYWTPGGPARVVLDRRHGHGLPARCNHADADARLCQPHPAADGHRPVRADAGRPAQAGSRLVPGGLCRCRRMGRVAQLPGDEPVRRRRRDGQQALHRHRQVHPAHEPALQGLPL